MAETETKPTLTVVDNSNLDAVLANARGEKYEPKPESKEAAKEQPDGEDDDFAARLKLTPEQHEAITEMTRKAVGKKHREAMETKEYAQNLYEENQAAKREADRLRRENERLKEQTAPPAPEAPKKPIKADFKTDEEYQEALVDYRVSEKLKEKEAADHKAAQEDRIREIHDTAASRLKKAQELVPDYMEKIEAAPEEFKLNDGVMGYMQESELFAEIGYYLASNVQELESISKMSPSKQLVAIGKIEGKLKPFGSSPDDSKANGAKPSQDGKTEKSPSPNAKASKTHPEPIKPIVANGDSQVEKDESEMDFEESFANWQKTHKTNLKARRRH